MNRHQLFRTTESSATFPIYVNPNGVPVVSEISNLPVMIWPNGRICFLASSYIISLFEKHLSRSGKGSTLHTYATQITHLLRYCYYNSIELESLTDSRFTHFIHSLSADSVISKGMKRRRTDASIAAIGRQSLSFLHYVGEFYGMDDFLGANGQIRAVAVSNVLAAPGRVQQLRKTVSWHHHSIPTPQGLNTRLPISTDVITELSNIVASVSCSSFIKTRRYAMLKLLEISGGRRSEIAAINLEDIMAMRGQSIPMLTLKTMKQGGASHPYREIPISCMDRDYLISFVEKNLLPFRLRHKISHTPGALLINSRTGGRLKDNTITQELQLLAKSAKVPSKCCPHMFRHRFVTKIFAALAAQYHIADPDSFKTRYEKSLDFRETVRQWTGHKSLESLNVYIHLAIAETSIQDLSSIKLRSEDYRRGLGLINQVKLLIQTDIHAPEAVDKLALAIRLLS